MRDTSAAPVATSIMYSNRVLRPRRSRRAPRQDRSCTFETFVDDGEVFNRQPRRTYSMLRPNGCLHVSVIRHLQPSKPPQPLRYTAPRWHATQSASSSSTTEPLLVKRRHVAP